MKKTLVILSLVVVVLIFTGAYLFAQTAPVPFLENPNFEDGFYSYQGIGELQIANGWTPWFAEGIRSPGGATYSRPEYKRESTVPPCGCCRVLQGQGGQKFFTTFAPHDAGIYQKVQTQPGQWYTFSANVQVWSSSGGGGCESISPPAGRYRAMVGANPWGDANAYSDTTIWGKEIVDVYNEWKTVSVTFEAWSTEAVVFIRGNPWYGAKHNDSYWDLASIRPVDIGTPSTPVPCPTCEPGTGNCPSIDQIRGAVREELDRTRLLVQ